jgi:holo-[acyl-carrier protein] synthase
MILGIGTDLCDIRRIEAVVHRYGMRFLLRCFTETERRRAAHQVTAMATYAKRFAAKEACAKALGTGIRRGVFWRDMGVVNRASGQPTMHLTGGALRRLIVITPAGYSALIHLSISDEHPYAQAFVIIEAIENEDVIL